MTESRLLRGVFFTLMCAVLMGGLYLILFGNPNGKWEGALMYSSRQIEYPISKYYYSYCFLPNVHMEDSVSKSLGGRLKADSNNMNKTESDLSTSDSDNDNFNSVPYHYSSGWY